MAAIKKLIQKMKNQPHGIILEEADRVLRHFGYQCDRKRGSHFQYVNEKGDVFTLRAKNKLDKAYIVSILELIGESK